jgi:hypothetical protein
MSPYRGLDKDSVRLNVYIFIPFNCVLSSHNFVCKASGSAAVKNDVDDSWVTVFNLSERL